MYGSTWIAILWLGAVVVSAALWAASGENVDTAFSGCLWALILVGIVVGIVWGFGAWVA